MKLKGKVSIITGGASGIGRGIALAMAKEGATVVIVDLNPEKGREAEAELQQYSQATFIQADISDKNNIKKVVAETVGKYGTIHIMVNNAHASRQVLFTETSQDDLDLSFNTGFYPTFYFMQECFPYLKENKGKVINFASGAGLDGMPMQAAYAAAKEAIRAISRTAANEWGPYQINVNCISPIALSPGVEAWKNHMPAEYEAMVQKIPLRRLGDCEHDIGRVAVFLASEDSDYITGQTIMVDGGSIKLR